jgi:glycosyltransferase involved in cell wall biosynthesis
MKAILEECVASSDVVHIHGLWEEVQHQAAVTARTFRKPHLFRPCGLLDPWSLAQKKWKKRLYLAWRLRKDLDRATAIHFTAELERDLTASLRLKAPSIVVPNGVDLDEFHDLPERGFLRSRFPELAGRVVVLFLSRIHHKKGLDILIPALAKLRRTDAVLVVAGPGDPDEVETLRRLAVTNGMGERVLFTGPLYGRERIAAYVDADVFVLPSRQENFGIVVIEALAAGTPVVISDQVNIHREIAESGVGAVSALNVEDFASTLDRWLADDVRRTEAAKKARSFAMTHYNWPDIAAQWQEIYGSLV